MRKRFDDVPEFSWLSMAKAVWFFLDGSKKKFVAWTAILFSVFFYQLIPSLVIAQIIDFFTKYRSGIPLTPFFIWVAFLGITNTVVSIIRLTAKNKLAEFEAEINYNAKVKGFERLVDFSLTWHDKENSGNKIQRIQNGISALSNARRLMSQDGFQTISVIAGIVAVFIFMSPAFALFVIVYLAVFLLINYSFYRRMYELNEKFNKARENASGSFFEGLSNVLTIKTLGAKESFKENIYAAEQQAKEHNKQMINIGINKWKIFQIFTSASLVVYLLMVGNSLIAGAITVGGIFIYYNYFWKFIDAAGTCTEIFERLIEIKAAIARMMPIYWENEAVVFGDRVFPSNWREIKIESGSFKYRGPKEKNKEEIFEIRDLSLRIGRREKIGIAGASGSGKSTLAKLLLGLYQLEAGNFAVDQTNFYDIRHEEITKNIAIVLQETEMFNLSMRENITLLRQVDPLVLARAIKIAQLEDLIARLPEGLETLIGEKGHRLSGGERQRVGIARAICKDPQLFVFDEATSALDTKTESLIQDALEKELSDKALIIIAHRVTTLENVNRILVFEKGRIVEQGKYSDLISDPLSKLSYISSNPEIVQQ